MQRTPGERRERHPQKVWAFNQSIRWCRSLMRDRPVVAMQDSDGISRRRNQMQTESDADNGSPTMRRCLHSGRESPRSGSFTVNKRSAQAKRPILRNHKLTQNPGTSRLGGRSVEIPTTSSEQHGTFCSEQRREQSCRISGNAWISWRVSPWCEDAGPLIFSHEGLR